MWNKSFQFVQKTQLISVIRIVIIVIVGTQRLFSVNYLFGEGKYCLEFSIT